MPKKYTVSGLKDVQNVLENIAPRHARNLARSTVQAVASEAAKKARSLAPKDEGILKKSIKGKRQKSPPENPRSAVVVERGAGVKNDGWYWHFLEYGTERGGRAHRFMLRTAEDFNGRIEKIYTEKFAKQLLKKIAREAKKGKL